MQLTAKRVQKQFPAVYEVIFREGYEAALERRRLEALGQQLQDADLLMGAARAVNAERERRGLARLG